MWIELCTGISDVGMCLGTGGGGGCGGADIGNEISVFIFLDP